MMVINKFGKWDKSILYILIISLSLIINNQVLGQDISAGLLAKYPFSGNSNDVIGVLNGINHGAQLAEDRFGNINSAYYFDGSGVYIEIPNNNLLDFEFDQNFTVSLWVNISSIQNDMRGHNNEILGKWNAFTTSSYPYAIRYWNENAADENKNKIFDLRYDSENCGHNPLITGSCSISSDEWHHLAYVKDGNVLSYYQDGQLFGTTVDNTSSSCNTTNNNPIYIGKRDLNTRYFTGSIDDISFYNRSLTPEEINLLVNENGWSVPTQPVLSFTSFAIPNQISSDIDVNNKSVHVIVPCYSDLTMLTPNFVVTAGSEAFIDDILQVSGSTMNDFTQHVKYKIKKNDLCVESEWTVTVEVQSFSQNYIYDATSFNSYSINNQYGTTSYNYALYTINIVVPCYTDLSSLVATFSVKNNSSVFVNTINQNSGITVNDFSDTVRYVIKNDETCSEQEWYVIIKNQTFAQNQIDNATSFKNFSINGQKEPTEIDTALHRIEILMPCGTDLSNLKSSFAIENGSIVELNGVEQESNTTGNSFLNPQTYIVTAPDICQSSTWDVYVSIETFDFETIDLYAEDFFVPNVITPNGDKKNDIFRIGTLLQGSHLDIYNRHGINVYESGNYRNQFTGSKLASGVYYYWIQSNCLEKPIVGPLNILK